MNKRLKNGLFWAGDKPPAPNLKNMLIPAFIAFLIVLAYICMAYRDEQAGMIEIQERQINSEIKLIKSFANRI